MYIYPDKVCAHNRFLPQFLRSFHSFELPKTQSLLLSLSKLHLPPQLYLTLTHFPTSQRDLIFSFDSNLKAASIVNEG